MGAGALRGVSSDGGLGSPRWGVFLSYLILIVQEIISAWHHTRAAKLGLFQADEDLGDPLAPTEGMQLAPRPPCTGTDTELTTNNATVKTT